MAVTWPERHSHGDRKHTLAAGLDAEGGEGRGGRRLLWVLTEVMVRLCVCQTHRHDPAGP